MGSNPRFKENLDIENNSMFVMDLHNLHLNYSNHVYLNWLINQCCQKEKVFIAATSHCQCLGYRVADQTLNFGILFVPEVE